MASVVAFLKSLFQKLITLFSKKKGEEVVDYYGCPNSKKPKSFS